MFLADGLRLLIGQPWTGIVLFIFVVVIVASHSRRSFANVLIRQVRGLAYLIIFGACACGALLLRQPLPLMACVGLAIYGIYEMRPSEEPSSKSPFSTLRSLWTTPPVNNDVQAPGRKNQITPSCPSCGADRKPIGEPGHCWYCRKPFPSETKT
jgi:hypothetical protein